MKKGFTFIEIIVVLAVVAILIAMVLPYMPRIFQQSEKATLDDLDTIKKAILGDPTMVEKKSRTSFGYMGDMGSLPSSLMDLLVQGIQPGFVYNPTLKAGVGWRGPYLQTPKGKTGQFNPDAYGNAYIYDTTQYVSPDTGVLVIAKIVSPGADLQANTPDDLKIEIFKSEAFSQVSGSVKDLLYNYIPNVEVTINYSNNGTLSYVQTITDSQGRYVFNDIPFGNRSITVEPQLVYQAKTALTTSAGVNLQFQVTNYSPNPITINSLKAVYSSSPVAYFEEVWIGGVSVWNYKNFGGVRAGSGQVVPFSSAQSINGTNLPNETVTVSLQAPRIELTDLIIGRLFQGQTITVQIIGFKDAPGSGGNPVSVSSVPFQVTFSDGSVAAFLPS